MVPDQSSRPEYGYSSLIAAGVVALSMCLSSTALVAQERSQQVEEATNPEPVAEVLEEINAARAQGRQCYDRYFGPVDPVEWSDDLAQAAGNHIRALEGGGGDDMSASDRYQQVSGESRDAHRHSIRTGTSPQAFNDLFRVPAACEVMMSEDLQEVGVARGQGESALWTMSGVDEADQPGDMAFQRDSSGASNEVEKSRELLELLNQVRSEGYQCPDGEERPPVRPIEWDDNIADAAAWYAVDMLDTHSLSCPIDSQRRNTRQRIAEDTGYDGSNGTNMRIADAGSAEEALQSILSVPAWCKWAMGFYFSHAGAATANNGETWAIDFLRVSEGERRAARDESPSSDERRPSRSNGATRGDDQVRGFPEILEAVNEVRSEGRHCGDEYMPAVEPVRWHNYLTEAAKIHTRDMERVEALNHTGSDGSNPSDRFTRVMGTQVFAAENIARGQQDVEAAIQSWVDSPGHCLNIMRPHHSYLGVAGTEETRYWTMKLAGSSTPASPVSSDRGGAQNDSSDGDQEDDRGRQNLPNWRADATQGTRELQAGFRPDPNQVPDFSAGESRVTANQGNSQRVPLQGCEGYINWDAPEIKMEYTAGNYPLTIWGYDPQLGTSILIRSPDGQWHCATGEAEDSAGAIRFESPASGTYSIWVGSTQLGRDGRPSDVRVSFSEFDEPEFEFDSFGVQVVE